MNTLLSYQEIIVFGLYLRVMCKKKHKLERVIATK